MDSTYKDSKLPPCTETSHNQVQKNVYFLYINIDFWIKILILGYNLLDWNLELLDKNLELFERNLYLFNRNLYFVASSFIIWMKQIFSIVFYDSLKMDFFV